MDHRDRNTLLLVAGLALAAVLVLGTANRRADGREFQALVGGLGFGPALTPSTCGPTFDPRLCPECRQATGPVPAGHYFCPRHGCAVCFVPTLGRPPAEDPGAPAP